jgi:hypothetical protein
MGNQNLVSTAVSTEVLAHGQQVDKLLNYFSFLPLK